MKSHTTSLGKYQIVLLYFISQLTALFATGDSAGDYEEQISSTGLCVTCQPTANKQITDKLPPKYNRLPNLTQHKHVTVLYTNIPGSK